MHIQITFSRHSYIDCSHGIVGSALTRLERSTHSDHKGTTNVVLRFIKIITPVECVIPLYDGYISCSKEGELHRKKLHWQSVWNLDLDKSQSLLYEVFNYFGTHSLLDMYLLDSTATSLKSHLIPWGRPMTLPYMSWGQKHWHEEHASVHRLIRLIIPIFLSEF